VTARPWDADRPFTLEDARAVIGACFPDVDAHSARHLGSGWDFDAFLTADGWVFRFPRRAECATLEQEQRVLEIVAGVLPPPIAVPRIARIGGPAPGFPYRFGGHRFIAGISGEAAEARMLPVLARDLGAALGAIHGVPETAARAAGIDDDGDRAADQAWFARGLLRAAELRGVDPVVDRALDWLRRGAPAIPTYRGPLRLVHDDLSPDHLVVDPTTGRLAGILDWSDARLGDPAADFIFLVTWHGWALAEAVLRSYPHALDAGWRERVSVTARLLSLVWLAEASERESELTTHVAWVRNAFA
jgi:aminoglycoside phosphotransferase (APT) family kinase protein